jgi:hypothetical protein
MKLAWKLLVGAGLLLVALAMGADTTVKRGFGRVQNLAMHQQLLFLVFGCVLFLAGVVLFGVAKLKQTPGKERLDKEKTEERIAALKGLANQIERPVGSTGMRMVGLIEGPLFAGDLWGGGWWSGLFPASTSGCLE